MRLTVRNSTIVKKRLLHSVLLSLEWRAIAFVITNAFLYMMTGAFWESTIVALELQIILLFAHGLWFFLRNEREHAHMLQEVEGAPQNTFSHPRGVV